MEMVQVTPLRRTLESSL